MGAVDEMSSAPEHRPGSSEVMTVSSNAAPRDDGVALQILGPIATIMIDRPAARNALGLGAWRALPLLIAAADRENAVGVIVVRGAGGHFGAGNDIAELAALRDDPAAAAAFGAAMATAAQSLEGAAKPVVVAIEGSCYGAAVALALAGDLRIASDAARFAVTPARLGALYLQSDLHRLVAAVGVGQTRKLIYTAESIGAAEALRIGLVDQTIPQDRFEPDLQRILETILSGSPFTLRGTKAMLREMGHGQSPRETPDSLAAFAAAMQGAEFHEGVSAFLARQAPKFR